MLSLLPGRDLPGTSGARVAEARRVVRAYASQREALHHEEGGRLVHAASLHDCHEDMKVVQLYAASDPIAKLHQGHLSPDQYDYAE
jgi:hypothetical protein